MLALNGLSKYFGGVRAVDGLDLEVREGEIFGLIGPNGSGKSTTVNLICGVFPVTAGEIRFRDRDITRAAPHVCLGAGIARTFQNIRLFGHLSVWQNLWVAQNAMEDRKASGFLNRWFSGSARARAEVEALLDFAGLSGKADDLAANLSFGEQRRLELARALAAKPTMLLLDEPAAGMNMEEIAQLRQRLTALREDGKTIPAGRARDGAGHGRHGPDRGPQFRTEDRRGDAGRDPERSAGAGGLSRRPAIRRGRTCLRSATSSPPTARSRRCAASICR